MSDLFVKVGGSNLLDGLTLGNAWETPIFGMTTMLQSDTLIFSGTSGGVFTWDRPAPTNPIPSGVSGNPTILTDNADGVVTFHHPGTGNFGFLAYNSASPAKQYISIIGTTPGAMKFDMEYQPFGAGVSVGDGTPDHLLFKNLEVTRCHASGFLTGGTTPNVTIDGCIVHSNGKNSQSEIPQDHGIYGHGPNLTIKNCEIYDNWGWGITINSSGAGVQPGQYKVYNNIVYNNGYGFGSESGDGIQVQNGNATVYNNLSFGNAGNGITFWRTSGGTIFHNTVHDNGRRGIDIGSFGTATNNIVKNNLVIGNGLGDINIAAGGLNSIVAWNVTGVAVTDPSSNATITNHKSGIDLADECVGPITGSHASRNYHLKTGAWSIGRVTDNEVDGVGVVFDYDNVSRPQGPYVCQGAYEFIPGGGPVEGAAIIGFGNPNFVTRNIYQPMPEPLTLEDPIDENLTGFTVTTIGGCSIKWSPNLPPGVTIDI